MASYNSVLTIDMPSTGWALSGWLVHSYDMLSIASARPSTSGEGASSSVCLERGGRSENLN